MQLCSSNDPGSSQAAIRRVIRVCVRSVPLAALSLVAPLGRDQQHSALISVRHLRILAHIEWYQYLS